MCHRYNDGTSWLRKISLTNTRVKQAKALDKEYIFLMETACNFGLGSYSEVSTIKALQQQVAEPD